MSHAPRGAVGYSLLKRPQVITFISCQGTDWQVSHLAQVLSQGSTTQSNVVDLELYVNADGVRLKGTDDVEWLHLLHQFPNVKTLRVQGEQLAEHIALALEEITTEMVAEVLPSLHSIFLAGLPASSVQKFVDLRQLSGRPVTVIDSETEGL